MIRVVYRDGVEDQVAPKFLDILLHLGEVQMFQRSEEWAVVGVDPVRNRSRSGYDGRERRDQDTAFSPPQLFAY